VLFENYLIFILYFLKNFFYKKKSFKTYIRYSIISSKFVNKKLRIYNGLEFKDIIIRPNFIGFKLGEFSFTKKKSLNIHIKKKKKKIGKKIKNYNYGTCC